MPSLETWLIIIKQNQDKIVATNSGINAVVPIRRKRRDGNAGEFHHKSFEPRVVTPSPRNMLARCCRT